MWKPKSVSIPIGAQVQTADTSGFRGYLLGSASAPVEITEYADYQCPACASFEQVQWPTVRRQLIDAGLVRWRYRDFPLDGLHPHARLAAHAAACANDQGKYWELKGLIYARHAEWANRKEAGGVFRELASEAGLDRGQYDACMGSAKYAGRIEASLQEGQKLGVPSTPSFIIGDRLYPAVLSSDSIRALVQALVPAAPPPPPPPAPRP
jgi:protein-disulfide isomerase